MIKSNNHQNKGSARRTPKKSQPKSAKNQNSAKQRRVTIPVAQSIVNTMGRPQISRGRNGDVTIRHREYFADILGSIIFKVQRSPAINAAAVNLFPWLNVIASNYESYRFKSLVFKYEPSCASTTLGRVMLAVDYDVEDPLPVSKSQVMAYRNTEAGGAWVPITQRSLPEDLNKRKSYYTRRGPISANADLELYDVGRLLICTQGMLNDTSTVGEIYIEYEVELMTPQLGDPGVGLSLFAELSGSTATNAFQTQVQQFNNLDLIVTPGILGQYVIQFPIAFEGYMTLYTEGTSIGNAGVVATAVPSAGSSVFLGSSATGVFNQALTKGMQEWNIKVAQDGTITLQLSNATITTTQLDLGQANVRLS